MIFMGGSRGGMPGTCPPKGPNSFILIYKILETYPPWESMPPYGKSWIRCNDTVYKVNFKFSLSSIFYIEEMLTIICNSSNGLYFVYLFAVDHSFHCNLDLETCPNLETCLELVLLPNYIDLGYKQ